LIPAGLNTQITDISDFALTPPRNFGWKIPYRSKAKYRVRPECISASAERGDRRSLAPDHRHVLRRVSVALDLDPRGCVSDCAEIGFRQLNLAGTDILL
jgi:hypothetical protein